MPLVLLDQEDDYGQWNQNPYERAVNDMQNNLRGMSQENADAYDHLNSISYSNGGPLQTGE